MHAIIFATLQVYISAFFLVILHETLVFLILSKA